MRRCAKIVATVGPSSSDERTLGRLFKAGVDVVRLNLSHGTREEHRRFVALVRRVSKEQGRFVAIVADLMGPRYRLGNLEEPRALRRGMEVSLGSDRAKVDLPLDDPEVLRHLKVGERVLLDNGLVEMEVIERRRGRVRAKVRSGSAEISSRKGINLPDSHLPFGISAKDRADIAFAVEAEVDFLAASYVGRPQDVEAIRKAARDAGGDLPVIAKLERGRALDHLDEIVEVSDAVMVARGDLGVEVPLHRVPVLQKRIIDACWRLGKAVIVATQMLESMIERPRPTRAESSDVANAVFDGADALMLSGETAAGRYPVEAVRTMDSIIRQAEAYRQELGGDSMSAWGTGAFDLEPPVRPGTLEIPETVSAAAVLSARHLRARAIVSLTQGGYTVRQLARRRPSTPVLALTRHAATARRLQLVWGVYSLLFEKDVRHHDEVVPLVDRALLDAGLVKVGDTIVILMGDPIQGRPPTNLMRIHRVRPV
jgi:pyruvate kinase